MKQLLKAYVTYIEHVASGKVDTGGAEVVLAIMTTLYAIGFAVAWLAVLLDMATFWQAAWFFVMVPLPVLILHLALFFVWVIRGLD